MSWIEIGVLAGIALPLLVAPASLQKLCRTRGWAPTVGYWWALCLLTVPASMAAAWGIHLVSQ